MQFTTVAAVAALAATAQAWYPTNSSSSVVVDYVTDVVTSYTTYCPEATTLTYNSVTYTITEATTLTVTNCPCTIVKPVTTYPVVYCSTCATSTPVYPVHNTTVATYPVGTSSVKATATPTPSTITTSGGNQLFAISGASLAGLLGLAAYIL